MKAHPALLYTCLRFVAFLGTASLLYLVGARGILLLVLAFLVSGVLSLVLLSRQRDAMSSALTDRGGRVRARLDEAAAAEDDDPPRRQ